jgi:hypothetical protein
LFFFVAQGVSRGAAWRARWICAGDDRFGAARKARQSRGTFGPTSGTTAPWRTCAAGGTLLRLSRLAARASRARHLRGFTRILQADAYGATPLVDHFLGLIATFSCATVI